MKDGIIEAMKLGEYLGHGTTFDGRNYEGYLIAGECRYFDTMTGEELPPEGKA